MADNVPREIVETTQRFAALHNPTVPDITRIMAYEEGELDREETIALFQDLIGCGLAWKLQGHYGRTAQRLIEGGMCTPGKR